MNYSQYDKIASKYDTLFRDETSLVENREVGGMLPPLTGSILDIGCGTGLLTEIADVNPGDYLGIDPSQGMLDQFIKKHPLFKRRLVCEAYTGHNLDCKEFDNVVALFGAPSYLSPYAILSIKRCKGHKFLMFYKENYHPVTYEKCDVEFKHVVYTMRELCVMFGEQNVSEYHNYLIVNCV